MQIEDIALLLVPETAEEKANRENKAAQARINGSKSHGPVSPEGKAASALNGIRHGLCGNRNTLLDVESADEYNEVREAYMDDLRPATKAEVRLVERIANLDWRIERMAMMETALLAMAGDAHFEQILASYPHMDGIGIVVASWMKDKTHAQGFELLRRYQTSLQNQLNAAIKNFRDFEKARNDRKRRGTDFDEACGQPYQQPQFETFELSKETLAAAATAAAANKAKVEKQKIEAKSEPVALRGEPTKPAANSPIPIRPAA